MNLGLEGRTALISGASAGIGRAIAVGLASEGVRLCVAARRRDLLEELAGEIKANGGKPAHVVSVDLADKEGPDFLCRSAVEALGKIDILVNSAGASSSSTKDWLNAPDDLWLNSLVVNFTQIRRLTQEVVRHMIQNKYGRIINVTGKAEPHIMNAGIPAKVAVNALAKGLSREVGQYGITVNSIAPGKIKSESLERRYSNQYKQDFSKNEIPLGRFGEPREIADLAVFLCSERASYITGNVIHVDGGMHRFAFS